ncbi:MAG: acyl-CoA dehydrogenase family protein [Actinobacteria bacterium]|nr:acyl-CoA dehydrogenase family protein [Actinomycetota bacterium]
MVNPPASAFRGELREWLHDNLTDELRAANTGIADASTLPVLRPWNAALADARWAAPAWPSEHGGRDATIDEQVAYLEEMSVADAPGPINVIGISNIAPAIMMFGTREQKDRFLRPMIRGEEIWSQGMSEPDAGSDLAALRTSAVLDGDDFVVNGQKTWNSLGNLADWCQLYVRTDPTANKHKGISCLLVDLRSPGIAARPLRTITGEESFADLFFTDVRVPASALLGSLDEGWSVAMATLAHERAGVARLHLMLARKLDRLRADPKASGTLGDPRLRQRLAAIHSEITCMRLMTDRALESAGTFASGAGGSLIKLAWSRCEQALANQAVDAVGIGGQASLDGPGPWAHDLLSSRQCSIAGGTTEINLNIVAEQVLGLPRDPR